ncbi:TetR family transcriptional regulator [Actinophytocola glycyrrhizae]|uniref:TetR family transcriptional regulator n=1 Tax=Actinophytocola glycyrrhizae TaxID=2044873 RepID=A0ABV9S341_9PSEU
MTRTNYHHGALREALLSATLELIEAEGIGAVSLRRVARAAGVSPARRTTTSRTARHC